MLEVSGSVIATSPRLEVRVVVANRGDHAVTRLDVAGELLGQRREAQLAGGIGAGESGAVVLDFEPDAERPGVHALPLLLEYPVAGPPDGAGNPPVESQRAWLLIALGENPPPAVRLEPAPLRLEVEGRLEVGVTSSDGRPHRLRLRVYTPRDLRPADEGSWLTVPAQGKVVAGLAVMRAGAQRGSRHAVLIVAETVEGSVNDRRPVQTSVAATTVEVAENRSWLRAYRVPVLVAGFALLALALVADLWIRARQARQRPT